MGYGSSRPERRSRRYFLNWRQGRLWVAFWVAVSLLLLVGWVMSQEYDRPYPVPTSVTHLTVLN